MRTLAEDQPIEQAATLTDVRAEVLAPERLNTVVFGVFAAVALAIAVIGVAGVLAFSVSAGPVSSPSRWPSARIGPTS